MNKNEKPARGRPRAFDAADVLRRAQHVFLGQGYEGLAYDQAALSLGLSKPSLYNAFGDKPALFTRAVRDYAARAHGHIVRSAEGAGTLSAAARQMLLAAADVYAPPSGPSTGCLLVGTALPACVNEEPVRDVLADFIAGLERDLGAVIETQYAADVERLGKSPRVLAVLFTSLLFSLAIRARMGVSRRRLRAMAEELAAAVV